jgi:hypothetical protein
MSRTSESARPISDGEAAVVQRALEVAGTEDATPGLVEQISQLRVVGRCGCGCASVDFRNPMQGQKAVIVADAVASSPNGEDVGLLVWALDGHLSGLEVYSYSDFPASLPVLESICCYQGTRGTDAA